MKPYQLHAVLWCAGGWTGQELILQEETSLESQTARGDGWKGEKRGGVRV